MLVKLGEFWVDPRQVIFINSSSNSVCLSVKEGGYVGGLTIFEADSAEEAKEVRDNFANIINNAMGQTFGGEDEEVQATA